MRMDLRLSTFCTHRSGYVTDEASPLENWLVMWCDAPAYCSMRNSAQGCDSSVVLRVGLLTAQELGAHGHRYDLQERNGVMMRSSRARVCGAWRTHELGCGGLVSTIPETHLWPGMGVGALILEISARHKSTRALITTVIIGPFDWAG